MSRTFTIDGKDFSTLEGFYDAFERVALGGALWGRNLDALDDALSGGVGDINSGDTFIWKNPMLSRLSLGYAETERQLRRQLGESDPSQHEAINQAIETAKTRRGETVFDWLVEIFREHDDITLVLE